MDTKSRKKHRNNKRGPKAKRTEGKFIEVRKQIKPIQLDNAIRYIVQHSDQLMWDVLRETKVQENTTADLWHAYGLRHACDLLTKFLYDRDTDYRTDLTQIRRPDETINSSDITHSLQLDAEAPTA